jgi:hypothetical protein
MITFSSSQPNMASVTSTTGSPRPKPGRDCRVRSQFNTMPDTTASPVSSIEGTSARALAVCSHSRLGNRRFTRCGPFRFSRWACQRYIRPAANPKSTVTAAARIDTPWTTPSTFDAG